MQGVCNGRGLLVHFDDVLMYDLMLSLARYPLRSANDA